MIDNLPAGDYIIWARTTDYSLFCDSPINVTVQTPLNTSMDIFLVPGGSISGQVNGIEPDMIKDEPLAVTCLYTVAGLKFGKSCTVAEDGTYSLEGIPPSTCNIKLEIWYSSSYDYEYDYETVTTETVIIKSGEHIEQDFFIKK